MSDEAAQFVFMTCRPGAEGAVKAEVARGEPAWRPSFSRPGFLTFKHAGERPLDERQLAERNWTFAHAHGISLGRHSGSQLAELAEQVWRHDGVAAIATMHPFADIHVWQREPIATDDRGSETFVTPLCEEIEHAVRAAAPDSCGRLRAVPTGRRRPTVRHGLVLDVVVVEPGEWWMGYHRGVTLPERWPGGAIIVSLPEHAVSRAYAKLEEALAWSGLPLAAGDECVEIGCAPGGASQALLDRGLFVTGVDPAEVDPDLLAHPRFRHLKKRAKEVRRREFLGVRWLTADMNIAPQATLDEVEAIVTHPDVTIRGMVLTLKLSEWSVAEKLPAFTARVRGWGYRDVRLRQLVTGGQEVCLVALRRKALRRLGRTRSRKRKATSGVAAAVGNRRDAPQTTVPEPHF